MTRAKEILLKARNHKNSVRKRKTKTSVSRVQSTRSDDIVSISLLDESEDEVSSKRNNDITSISLLEEESEVQSKKLRKHPNARVSPEESEELEIDEN